MKAKEWLNSKRDYAEGVQIYNAYKGEGSFEKKYRFTRSERSRAANLWYELNKLAKQESLLKLVSAQKEISNKVELSKAEFIKSTPSAAEQATYLQLPDELKTKWIEKGKLYSEAGSLRKFLFSSDKAVRKNAALRIVECMKRNRELWDEIDYWLTNKSFKPKKSDVVSLNPDELDVNELIKLKANLAPWLSKEKKKIEKEQNEEKKVSRLAKYNEQLIVFNRVKELLQ